MDNGLGCGEVSRRWEAQTGQAMCMALSQESEISVLTHRDGVRCSGWGGVHGPSEESQGAVSNRKGTEGWTRKTNMAVHMRDRG